MTRRCSHCSHNGHNSRTCPNRGVKLFGVRLTDGSIRKSASMGNLSHYAGSSGVAGGGASPAEGGDHGGDAAEGYASEDFAQRSGSSSRERKRGVPWTEEEHRMFLLGLQKLGKGDWRGIARNFVISRTPTQVASHAQKYFIRQSNLGRRKRRSSLFDIVPDEAAELQLTSMNSQESELQESNQLSELHECESMDSNNSVDGEVAVPKQETSQCTYPVMYPAFFTPVLPYSLPLWPSYNVESTERCTHEIVKPTAVHSKVPINVDELVAMSRLSIGESVIDAPSPPIKNSLGDSNRQSAFRANPASTGSGIKSSKSPIKAV